MEVGAPQLSPHEVHRPVRSLLWLVVALLSVFGVNVPSSAAASGPETRVRAIPTTTAAAVGQSSTETAGHVGCLRPSQSELVVGSCVATNRADDVVGSHGSMPRPRPAGMESHHGVNSVWAEANIPGYRAADAPAVLMPSAGHNATRGVFNRWRSEIAGRQGVPIRDIDWAAVSPGSAWSLAEEQFAAAGTAASTIDDYFAQWNRYLDGLRGGM